MILILNIEAMLRVRPKGCYGSPFTTGLMHGLDRGTTSDDLTLASLRRFLLVTLIAGAAGMGVELMFIGHVEDRLQLVPVVLLTAGVAALLWHAVRPGAASVRAVRLLMMLFVGSGVLGVGLHYRGNHEFEREMYPTMAGVELVRNTLTGATPVLAPGSMALLGLVGLAAVHRLSPGHRGAPATTKEEES